MAKAPEVAEVKEAPAVNDMQEKKEEKQVEKTTSSLFARKEQKPAEKKDLGSILRSLGDRDKK